MLRLGLPLTNTLAYLSRQEPILSSAPFCGRHRPYSQMLELAEKINILAYLSLGSASSQPKRGTGLTQKCHDIVMMFVRDRVSSLFARRSG
jgi:hypothetical protein